MKNNSQLAKHKQTKQTIALKKSRPLGSSAKENLFFVGSTMWVYPEFVRDSEMKKKLFRALLLFLTAAKMQYWVLFAAWCIAFAMLVFKLGGYAYLILPLLLVVISASIAYSCKQLNDEVPIV